MTTINHINIANEEKDIYCCLRNKVVRADAEHQATFCSGCKMFAGTAEDRGIECRWDDQRAVSNPHLVEDPYQEWMSNQSRKVLHYTPLLKKDSENTAAAG